MKKMLVRLRVVTLAAASAALLAAETTAVAAPPVTNEKIVGVVSFPNPKLFFHADGSPVYRAFYRERYEYLAEHFFAPANDAEIQRLKDIQFGDTVTAILWLSQSAGGEKYLQQGHDLFGLLLGYADGNQAVSRDCFGFYPVLKAALLLRASGRFDPAWEPALRRFVKDGVTHVTQHFPGPSSGNSGIDGNQGLARMYGCLLAKKLYPDMPEAVSATTKVNVAFTRIIEQGDIHVDSRNYFEVSLTFFIQIAHELGREGEIAQSPTFKRMFANFRDAISPNGFLPEFGHGYFSPNHYANTPIFLEYAGALFHDPTFAAAARRYFGMLVQSGPERDANVRNAIHSCVHVMPQLLDFFQPVRGSLPPPEFISGVAHRIAKIGGERPAFLILRPSVTPGAPMILMDLLGQGDHAQPEFTASVSYYESGHVPLFYQYGRYLSGASRGNQVVFGPPGATEPDPEWKADMWRTLSIPTDRLAGPDGRATIAAVSLRTDDRSKRTDRGLVLDNLRLSGPAGTKPVCDLAQGIWAGNSHSTMEGKLPGSHAIRILDDGQSCTLQDFQPLTFDPQQYVELLCDVKWFGKGRPDGQLRPTSDARSWMPVAETTLRAVLKEARTERHGEDCQARLEYSSYGTFDTSLVRQIVLTREGVLAIRDDIVPGATADGHPAFSLWQMYSIDSEGPARFSSCGECAFPACALDDPNRYRRGMSVYFSGPAGTAFGKQIIPGGKLPNYREIQRDLDLRTAYGRLTMHAGKAAYLNLLVVPHAPDQDLSRLDGLTSTRHDSGRSQFHTVCDGVPVTIQIACTGDWEVRR